jgi:IS5 family transposase
MLKPKSPQESFYGSYLYDRIVPIDHLLRKINQVVDFSFARQLFEDRYHPDIGRPAEDPQFMLRLCLLQYLYGDSDRQVIENARLNLAYKYFLGLAVDAEVPDYTTISYFRAQRLGEEKFRLVLEQVVKQCIVKRLVTGKRQIIDSTPVIANITPSSLTGLVRKCRENVLKTIEKQDSRIARKLGIKELEKAELVKWPGYKAHLLMEEESGIITSVETTPANATDGSQLKPLLKEQAEVHALKPQEVTADKAYDWGENLESLASNKTIANIALPKSTNHRNEGYFSVEDFLYDPKTTQLMCPAGYISTNCYKEVLNNNPPSKQGYAFRFRPSWCNVCPLKPKCVRNKQGRRIYISYYEPYFRLARERLATDEGQQAYRNRYKIEQKVADLTRYCGLRRCRYRGLDRAGIHTLLATIVCNIKRMAKLLWGKPGNYYLESPVVI